MQITFRQYRGLQLIASLKRDHTSESLSSDCTPRDVGNGHEDAERNMSEFLSTFQEYFSSQLSTPEEASVRRAGLSIFDSGLILCHALDQVAQSEEVRGDLLFQRHLIKPSEFPCLLLI